MQNDQKDSGHFILGASLSETKLEEATARQLLVFRIVTMFWRSIGAKLVVTDRGEPTSSWSSAAWETCDAGIQLSKLGGELGVRGHRRQERSGEDGEIPPSAVGMESLLVAAATYEIATAGLLAAALKHRCPGTPGPAHHLSNKLILQSDQLCWGRTVGDGRSCKPTSPAQLSQLCCSS
ncbi:hypothetical protein P4O66_020617 [Electrophorus voltai]|uniref:Uncharacterized protein n=1 Tax=Electrophorus voltai TaxID=2609070 RepID=A0AAD8ZTT6_9TELE|nr:hypothetical protein P4O66_020617 [Electrophorus voltai]